MISSYAHWLSLFEGDEKGMRSWLEVILDEEEKEISIEDIFCQLYKEMTEEASYPIRRKAYDAMVILYNTLPEISEIYEHISDTGPYKERFQRRDRVVTQAFDDGINYTAPKAPGLYFIGETHFNPITDEKFYWVKIGMSANLARRLKDYNTSNPMMWRIDYLTEQDTIDLDKAEEAYHGILYEKAIATCNHNKEWFMVDRETYLAMCEQGFAYFENNN